MEKVIICLAALAIAHGSALAITTEPDSTEYVKVEDILVSDDTHRVITNPWSSNWFVFADGGVNAFWGDKPVGKFGDRLTPQFNIGVGKWIVPGFGIDFQFTGFRSKGDKGVEGIYTYYSPVYYDKDGKPYWKEKIKWWDLNISALFNITRLIYGYEGYNSPRLKNQFIASIGIGATHHYGLPYGSANEWSCRVELQYSRFLTKAKAVSIDVKLRGLFYETKYDGVFNHQTFDENVSLNLGLTYYFNPRGWDRYTQRTTIYKQYNLARIQELNDEINRLRSMPVAPETQNLGIVEALKDVVTFPYLVNFVIDRVEVVNRERVNLGFVAEMMKATPDQRYLITGSADKYTGSVARNKWLGENRAKNVYTILTEEFGGPEEQLELRDLGGIDNIFYDDPQLSRSAVITRIDE
ncbi:MAG: OmpA family protein [Bacteroidales bacterium]|nr:OmpA family protein [Bacteroidales bacterium]